MVMDISQFLRQAGEEIEIRRNGQTIATAKGVYNRGKKLIEFMPNTDVEVGDFLFRKSANQLLRVMEIDACPGFEGRPFSKQAFFEPANRPSDSSPSPSVTINVGTAYGSIIGTGSGHSLTTMFNYQSVYEEIDRQGGEDAEALRKMVAEIQVLLEQQKNLPKGFLAKFGDLLKRNSWAIEAVLKAVLTWAMKT